MMMIFSLYPPSCSLCFTNDMCNDMNEIYKVSAGCVEATTTITTMKLSLLYAFVTCYSGLLAAAAPTKTNNIVKVNPHGDGNGHFHTVSSSMDVYWSEIYTHWKI